MVSDLDLNNSLQTNLHKIPLFTKMGKFGQHVFTWLLKLNNHHISLVVSLNGATIEVRMGVSFVSYLEKIDRDISGAHYKAQTVRIIPGMCCIMASSQNNVIYQRDNSNGFLIVLPYKICINFKAWGTWKDKRNSYMICLRED